MISTIMIVQKDVIGMIRFEIMGGVRVYGLSKKLRDKVYHDLSFPNKTYTDAKKYGRYISSEIQPFHHFFSVNKEEKYLYVPRGYFYHLHMHIHQLKLQHEIVDKTLVLPELELTFKGTPRDYQEKAIKEVMRYPNGVLQGTTGCGKTFMGINMIAKRKQPTLVLVHSRELLDQWVDSIDNLLGVPVGIVGGGKFNIEDITVGIVNSVKNKAEELRGRFGHIICDEVHRSVASMWTETLGRFPAKYYLGLSATVYRNDGLDNAINAFIGPTMHKVDKEHLFKTGAVLKPEVIKMHTHFDMPPRSAYSDVVHHMVKDKHRNKLIVDTVMNDIIKFKSPILIVSDRVKHCEVLASMLESKGADVSLLMSKMSKGDRLNSVEDIRDGSTSILIATVALIGEGFDAPNLHALFLTTPIKFEGRIVQTVGRILRPEKGKTARLYDFRDDNIWMLKSSGKKRDAVYKKEWS